MRRYLEQHIKDDLEKKMVFVGGPRQVGKTTLSQQIVPDPLAYLNFDATEHRQRIMEGRLPDCPAWIFDEIHKYTEWRNFLKGLYDVHKQDRKILVTGSARLDYYRYSGDSLQGRYFYLRLHPLSFAELDLKTPDDLKTLLTLGGFPEPYLGGSETEARRWSREYRLRVIEDEVRVLENLKNLQALERLLIRMPDLVGSLLSINNLSEDLQISFKTMSNWIDVLERMYCVFRLPPFGSPALKALKKSQKHYHFDWTLVKNPGARFENLIACHLLKWVHYRQDTAGAEMALWYFRDHDGHEVDFIVTQDGVPVLCLETKLSPDKLSASLTYLKKKFPQARVIQLHAWGDTRHVTPEGISIMPAHEFLTELI